MTSRKIILTALLLTTAAFPATAQQIDNRELLNRLDQLERNVMVMQRQASNGGSMSGGDSGPTYSTGGVGAAQAEVRIADLQEQLRRLQGSIEENSYQSRMLSEKLDKLSADVDYRLQALEQSAVAPTAIAPAPTAAPVAAPVPAQPVPATTAQPVPPSASGTLAEPTPPVQDASGNMAFNNPRDHYNYAFRLLNQAKYPEAAASFDAFTRQYPNDPLIGNSFYWLGETYYVRQDYIKAADYFRQGFEKAPSGPKAADNLLKLSMSLSAINRNKEACVVLNQLLVKFGNNSKTIKLKTQQEISRIGCN